MNEIALYRKYRPHTFKDVLGQEGVLSVIEPAIKSGNVSHAYLFSGSRGTGKTSVARILAREIGCTERDLYEIDGASNRKVDDVRELRESVLTLPYESPYKVYIIDEAHMLTREAFNALLKTLEEPPKHVVFMLATTEPHRLPDTIVSRCETHSFQKPNISTLMRSVLNTAKKEGYICDKESAELISVLGDGSFRDTLGVLQKVLNSIEGKKITIKDTEKITGAPSTVLISDLVVAMDSGDLDSALKTVSTASSGMIDMQVYIKLVLDRLRMVLLLRFSKDMQESVKEKVSPDTFDKIKEISLNKSSMINAKALEVFIDTLQKTKYAYIPELPLEIALMKLLGGEQ